MEHLLSPRERRERKAEICAIPAVPWLGFDHDDHEYPLPNAIQEYPLIRGWTPRDVQELKLGNVGNRSPREALAMIQSWMFLGLLESVSGSRFRSNSFLITTVDGQRTVHAGFLRTWIDKYHSTNNLNPTSDIVQRNMQLRRLTDSLTYAGFWNQRLVDMQKEVNPPLTNSEFFGPVHRLITLVAEALWAVAQLFPSPGERVFINCDFVVSEENKRDLRARLTCRGWCPSLYNKIAALARTTASFLEYASLIPPLGDAPRRHRDCSLGECVEHNLDESKYRTKHKVEGCQCETIGPPVEEVKKALHNRRCQSLTQLLC